MRFSIIIPVYNVEKYIQKCLDSVAEQTFSDYEAIIVDDETPDNSMALVQPYVDADPQRFRVIHQKNKGLGGARNTGVAAAEGEYILFLDSDDYVHPDMLQTLDHSLRENPCELLVFNYAEVNEKGKITRAVDVCADRQGRQSMKTNPDLLTMPQIAWNKVYLRSFYLECQIDFPDKTTYEDSIVRIFVAKAASVGFCRECLYYYVQRKGSIMHSKISGKMLDVIKVSDILLEELAEELDTDGRKYLEAMLVYDVCNCLNRINLKDYKSDLQLPLVQYISDHFQNYGENPYIAPRIKEEVACLCAKEFKRFHYRYCRVRWAKTLLLQLPGVAGLNALRKKT